MHSGDVLVDRFRIEDVAGAGAMGVVYRALDMEQGATVAVKILQTREYTARFDREARVLATLGHPSIVRYRAHGFSTDGTPYLVTDWINGPTLASRLRTGPMSIEEVWTLGEGIADALGCAHAAGVVHRDVKPANILLPDGDPAHATLVDFGVARWFDAVTATATGVAIGTPTYMAPEQARGDRGVDARADVFALGCVLFECLAGRPPFVGDHALAVLAKLIFESTPHIELFRPDVPPALAEVLMSALAKEPDRRPHDGAALRLVLTSARSKASVRPSTRTSQDPKDLGLFSVVMAAGAGTPFVGDESTLAAESSSVLDRAVEFGGRAEVLWDGTILVMFSTASSAADLAVRAANFAVRLRAQNSTVTVVVATGLGDRSQPWPVGVAIDAAAELLRAAPAGSETASAVRLDETTAGLLDGRFDVSRADGTWLLRGHAKHPLESRLLLGRPTPCVGRERELAFLESMFEECISENAPRAALVIAPPGVGKSRIRLEIHRRLVSRSEPPVLWTARAEEFQSSLPFSVVAGLLHSAAGIDSVDAPGVRRLRIEAFVRGLSLGSSEPRVVAFLCELGGADGGEPHREVEMARKDLPQLKELMTRVWVQVAAAASGRGPLVWTIDDAHWADSSSFDLLDVALQDLADKPVFLLLLGRPEIGQRWSGRGGNSTVQQLQLAPVPRRACETLAREVLGENASAETIARIVDLAAGNAFFLEELIRASARGQGDTLPASVLAMVHARIDAQAPDVRHLLRSASVLGMTFAGDDVTTLLGEQMGAKDTMLQRLVSDEMLSRRAVMGSQRKDNYVFRHALLREAAYAMLPDAERADLHERAAVSCLARNDASAVADAAEHLERAATVWSVATPERAARLFAEAAKLRHRTHQVAASLTAMLSALRLVNMDGCPTRDLVEWLHLLASAVSFVRVADGLGEIVPRVLSRVDAAGTMEERVHARIALARALGGSHDFNRAFPLVSSAVDAASSNAELSGAVRAVELELAQKAGDYRRALAAGRSLLDIGLPADPRVWASLAGAYAATGEHKQSEEAIGEARRRVPDGDVAMHVEVEKTVCLILAYRGEFAAAAVVGATVGELAEQAGLSYTAALSFHNSADSLQRLGDNLRARAGYERSLSIARKVGMSRMVVIDELHLAYLDGLSGKEDTTARMRVLLEEAEAMGGLAESTGGAVLLGLLLRHQGDTVGAIRELNRALSLARTWHNSIEAQRAEAALAEIASTTQISE